MENRENQNEPLALTCVREFHELMNQPVLSTPTIPSEERCNLRVRLLQEELDEFIEAIKNKDIVEIADALGDLQYILSGTVHEFGLGDRFKEVFDDIHRSNMSKVCSSEEEAQKSCEHWASKEQPSHYEKRGIKYIIYRDFDNKVLKSINYSPANLKEIVTKLLK